jgi:HlyD family secretion protein
VDAYPDRVFEGEVEQIRQNATMTQNVVTYTVVVNVENSDLALLPYLTANLQFKVGASDNVLKVPNAALRYRPPLARIHPDYADKYAGAKEKRSTTAEMKVGTPTELPKGTVWVEDGTYLVPITVTTGLTDGVVTEVTPTDGELDEGSAVVVGEAAAGSTKNSNPFQVKMFSGKKKE